MREVNVANVHDVAAAVLRLKGRMTAMKLQKLVYYCQAWSLVWDGKPLFDESIEAWANGPVVPILFEEHRGKLHVTSLPKGEPDAALSPEAWRTVKEVVAFYGEQSPEWLSKLTHAEGPWLSTRGGLAETEKSSKPITVDAMRAYYSALNVGGGKALPPEFAAGLDTWLSLSEDERAQLLMSTPVNADSYLRELETGDEARDEN